MAHPVPAAWLQQLIGEWRYTLRTADDSEHPGFVAKGTEVVRRIGDHFVAIENSGPSDDGSSSHAVTLVGYEPASGRFSGAVAGTAVPKLFVYDGALADDGRSLLLETEGPAMTEGQTTDRYRDVFRVDDEDHRSTAAEVWDGGAWKEFMRTDYERVG
jgi:hypothetical protein